MKVVEHIKKSPFQGLYFLKIVIKSLRVVPSDGLFANSPGLENRVWYARIMVDYNSYSEILQYWSSRCHRVTRSVTADEVYALTHAMDVGMLMTDALNAPLGQRIEMKSFVDSGTLFTFVTINSNFAERCLKVDRSVLKEVIKTGN